MVWLGVPSHGLRIPARVWPGISLLLNQNRVPLCSILFRSWVLDLCCGPKLNGSHRGQSRGRIRQRRYLDWKLRCGCHCDPAATAASVHGYSWHDVSLCCWSCRFERSWSADMYRFGIGATAGPLLGGVFTDLVVRKLPEPNWIPR